MLVLLKAACVNNSKNALDALLYYKKTNESVFYGIHFFDNFAVEDIKQYFDTLIKYLQPNIILNSLLLVEKRFISTLQDGKYVIDPEKLKCVGELIAALIELGAGFNKSSTSLDLNILHIHIALFIDKNIISMKGVFQKAFETSIFYYENNFNCIIS